MGRTNIVLDDKLVNQAMRAMGKKTKREVVDAALREALAARRPKSIRKLFGSGALDPNYDYKAARG